MNSTIQLSDHPALEETYTLELRNVLLSKLSTGSLGFESLVSSAEGAFPTDVMSVLRTLAANGQVSESLGLWFLSNALSRGQDNSMSYRDPSSAPLSGLPEPHPLDFDWRFTESTLPLFGNLISTTNSASGAILGAPSLYKYLADSGVRVSLFDKNPRVVQHLRSVGYSAVHEVDLTYSSEFLPEFQWVIADPPWYPEHYEGFIRAASRLILTGGKLLLSVLPRLTRPSASSDRFLIMEMAQRLGFDLVDIHPGALKYASPPFEMEALREEGLELGNWRKGDLFTFIRSSNTTIESTTDKPTDNGDWKTIPLGTTSVGIKHISVEERVPFSYRPASSTGTVRLHSVSRRSPSRSEINVWTSRNIALVVSKPRVLTDALAAISDGTLPSQTLGAIRTTYGLTDSEAKELQKVLELLLHDAGLPWD